MNRPDSVVTTMMDVNDDCLREIFAHLDKEELCDAAETCKRFRTVAQATFRTSTFKTVSVDVDFNGKDGLSRSHLRLLRNFGESIESIYAGFRHYVDDDDTLWHLLSVNERFNGCFNEFFNEFFVYVGQYCGRKLKRMNLSSIYITDEIAHNLRPAILNLQELQLSGTRNDSVLLNNLHSWSPNLRDLRYYWPRITQNGRLRHKFPQLQNVLFHGVRVDDIEDFLRINPQLKNLACETEDNDIFRVVATHMPTIEHLDLWAEHAKFPQAMAHLNELRSLKSIRLGSGIGEHAKPPTFDSAIHSMEVLVLIGFDFHQMSTELTRLSNLKKLELSEIDNLKVTHIFDILVECRQLRHLILERCDDLNLTVPNLLDILRYGDALERVEVNGDTMGSESIILDASLYLKMVNIVKSRSGSGMKMELYSDVFVDKIPDSLIAEHKNVLDLIITDYQ